MCDHALAETEPGTASESLRKRTSKTDTNSQLAAETHAKLLELDSIAAVFGDCVLNVNVAKPAHSNLLIWSRRSHGRGAIHRLP